MAAIDYRTRRVTFRVVYLGPEANEKAASVALLERSLAPRVVTPLAVTENEGAETTRVELRGARLRTLEARFEVVTVLVRGRIETARKDWLAAADGAVLVGGAGAHLLDGRDLPHVVQRGASEGAVLEAWDEIEALVSGRFTAAAGGDSPTI